MQHPKPAELFLYFYKFYYFLSDILFAISSVKSYATVLFLTMISLSWPTSRHTKIMRYFIALFIGYKTNLTVSCTFSQNAWQNVRSPNSLGVQRTKKRGCWGLGRPGPTGSKSAPTPRYRSWARSTSRGPTCGSSSWSSPGAARPRPGACPIRFPGQRDVVSARFPIIAPVWRWTMLDYTPTACWSTTGRGGQGKDLTELKNLLVRQRDLKRNWASPFCSFH